jgi:flagellar motor switch protein FliN
MAGEHAMNLLTAAEQALALIPLPPLTSELPRGARPMRWREFDGAAETARIDRPKPVGNQPVALRIELGRTQIYPAEATQLRRGTVVPLDNAAADPVDLYAAGRLVARGEALAIEGRFGVRVTELIPGT